MGNLALVLRSRKGKGGCRTIHPPTGNKQFRAQLFLVVRLDSTHVLLTQNRISQNHFSKIQFHSSRLSGDSPTIGAQQPAGLFQGRYRAAIREFCRGVRKARESKINRRKAELHHYHTPVRLQPDDRRPTASGLISGALSRRYSRVLQARSESKTTAERRNPPQPHACRASARQAQKKPADKERYRTAGRVLRRVRCRSGLSSSTASAQEQGTLRQSEIAPH